MSDETMPKGLAGTPTNTAPERPAEDDVGRSSYREGAPGFGAPDASATPAHPDGRPTAADLEAARRVLGHGFTEDELAQIPVVPAGETLRTLSTYVDLNDAERTPFQTTVELVANATNLYVPRAGTPHRLWSRLTGPRDSGPEEPATGQPLDPW